MKKIILLLSVVAILSSCAVNKIHIRDYDQRMQLVKTNFPEIYELFSRGAIIINDVYTYEKNGTKQVHINYRYR